MILGVLAYCKSRIVIENIQLQIAYRQETAHLLVFVGIRRKADQAGRLGRAVRLGDCGGGTSFLVVLASLGRSSFPGFHVPRFGFWERIHSLDF